jgi:hydrogenase nickel incorporation protein HypA/HybF
MHELSVAMSIIELAEKEADRRGARVEAVHLRLGPLAGVVKEALLSCYEVARESTSLAGSRLIIEEMPIVVYCSRCRARRTLESMQEFICPECCTPAAEVLQGRELEVFALELQE